MRVWRCGGGRNRQGRFSALLGGLATVPRKAGVPGCGASMASMWRGAAGDSGHGASRGPGAGERVCAYQRRLADSRLQRIDGERIVQAFVLGPHVVRPNAAGATELSGESRPGRLLLAGGLSRFFLSTSEVEYGLALQRDRTDSAARREGCAAASSKATPSRVRLKDQIQKGRSGEVRGRGIQDRDRAGAARHVNRHNAYTHGWAAESLVC